jgi:tripartite-type tricarboxylate transporter receptor subunit TctC
MRRLGRGFASLKALAVGLAFCACGAHGQGAYPNRPVKLVVGFSAGSATDTAARLLAEQLRPILGQQVVVENRSGAASAIATDVVASSPNDGYTLLFSSSSATVNAAARDSANTRAYRSLVPVGLVASIPNILVVHPSLGVKSVSELIAFLKDKPGAISYASSGPGSSPHMSAELFASRTGVDILHVPYKGSSAAMTDVLSGLVPIMFAPASSVLPHIASGKLIALATTGTRRTSILDVPTLDESGLKGFNVSLWFGVLAPKGMPTDDVNKLAAAINKALDQPEIRSQLAKQSMEVVKSSPAEFAAFINSEVDRWGVLMKNNKIAIE